MAKNQANAKQHPGANFYYLKIIHILHSLSHPKIRGHVLKNKQKNKYLCVHKIIRLIVVKMKMKMETREHIYDINLGTRKNRPKSRHGHKYT